MGRSIAIFLFFAISTVAIIVLQPGPKEVTYVEPAREQIAASRNDTSILEPAINQPAPTLPDDVVIELKTQRNAAADPGAGEQQQAGRSLVSLQAALSASLNAGEATVAPVSDVVPAVAHAPEPTRVVSPVAVAPVDPSLRDMSWSTLGTLQQLGRATGGESSEGALISSIVRRSMTFVDGTAPIAAPAQPRSAQLGNAVATNGLARLGEYRVEAGDNLALIAVKLYGSALKKSQLLADNPVLRTAPDSLRIGQKLMYRLP